MPLDDYTRAELRRNALGYVQRQTAHEDVPVRLAELRMNIERLKDRDGRASETREQNEFELDQLEKLAAVLGVSTDQSKPEEEAE